MASMPSLASGFLASAVDFVVSRGLDFWAGAFLDWPYFDIPYVGRPFNVLSASACAALRCFSGFSVADGLDGCARPQKRLKLYEFEACPFCRTVREALCTLDLDVEVYPCPKPVVVGRNGTRREGSSRFRSQVAFANGKTRFPVLVDENSGATIRGSDEIVDHLWKHYGAQATPPLNYRAGRILDGIKLMFFLPMLFRLRSSCGISQTPSKVPEKMFVLYGMECSPFVKIVREALCCLELPYLQVNVAHGSVTKRQQFLEKHAMGMRQKSLRDTIGAIQVPLLVDPNNGDKSIFESADIVRYLYKNYGAAAIKRQ